MSLCCQLHVWFCQHVQIPTSAHVCVLKGTVAALWFIRLLGTIHFFKLNFIVQDHSGFELSLAELMVIQRSCSWIPQSLQQVRRQVDSLVENSEILFPDEQLHKGINTCRPHQG